MYLSEIIDDFCDNAFHDFVYNILEYNWSIYFDFDVILIYLGFLIS